MNSIRTKKWLVLVITCTLMLGIKQSFASPISFGFSVQLEYDGIGFSKDTVVYGEVTYESNQSPYQSSHYGDKYEITSIWLNVEGEETIAYGGRIFIDAQSNYLAINTYDGAYNNFTNSVLGNDVLYASLEINTPTILNDLPADPAFFYGLTGRFGMNRTVGSLFDINSLSDLKVPGSSSVSPMQVDEPPVLTLLLIGAGAIGTRAYARRKSLS